MKQKIIYKLFLIIGSLFILSNSSCDKQEIDYIVNTKYYYMNHSQYDITLDVYNYERTLFQEYNIPLGDTLLIELVGEGGAGPFQYDTNLFEQGDSVVVTFLGHRFISFIRGNGVLYEKSYNRIKISDKEYKMYYDFTNEDYENALEIK